MFCFTLAVNSCLKHTEFLIYDMHSLFFIRKWDCWGKKESGGLQHPKPFQMFYEKEVNETLKSRQNLIYCNSKGLVEKDTTSIFSTWQNLKIPILIILPIL